MRLNQVEKQPVQTTTRLNFELVDVILGMLKTLSSKQFCFSMAALRTEKKFLLDSLHPTQTSISASSTHAEFSFTRFSKSMVFSNNAKSAGAVNRYYLKIYSPLATRLELPNKRLDCSKLSF